MSNLSLNTMYFKKCKSEESYIFRGILFLGVSNHILNMEFIFVAVGRDLPGWVEATPGQCGVEILTTLEVAGCMLGVKVHVSLACAWKMSGQTLKVAEQEEEEGFMGKRKKRRKRRK